MDIKTEKIKDELHLTFSKISFEGPSAQEFRDHAISYIENGERNFVLHFPETTLIDSSGIGKLLFLRRKLFELEGSIRLEDVTDDLYNLLDELTITKVIEIKQ